MISIKRIIAIVTTTMAFVSCNDHGTSTESATYLHGQEFTIEDGDLYVSDLLALSDSMIVFKSYDNRGNVKVFKRDGMTISESYMLFRKGRGEQEINFAISKYHDGTVFVFNKFGRNGIDKFFKARINVEEPQSLIINRTDWLNDIQTFGDFIPISDSTIIAIAGKWKEKELISLINISNKERTPIKFWPEDRQEAPTQNKQVLYSTNAQICMNAERTKLVYACGEGKYLDIMTIEGMNITGHNVVLDILPEYSYDGRNIILKNKDYRGIKIAATGNKIYVTYSNPAEDRDYKGFPWYFTDVIDVYDWDGNKLQRYVTDQPFYTFSVTDDDSEIFALTQDNDSKETVLKLYSL